MHIDHHKVKVRFYAPQLYTLGWPTCGYLVTSMALMHIVW
jgi:hypothetical protein